MEALAREEPPIIAKRVAAGELPPMADRIPLTPSVASHTEEHGEPRYGGDLRLLMGREKDVRLMVVYGYARLVAFGRDYHIIPDILRDIEVEEGRVFTLHLREGHRWSDGTPFTSEAFRYYWEDIATHAKLAPFGLPSVLLVDGKPPHFEVLDALRVRYTWDTPNPFFLPALAGARPETIYAPGHYLKQFHGDYASAESLQAMVDKEQRRNWASVHTSRFRPYKNTNPDLPSLQPWVNQTRPPSPRYVFERNPYFHRVDPHGRQLPYIDRVVMDIVDGKLIPAKVGAGESDLQARHLLFSDYTFLKRAEKRSNYKVHLWGTTGGSHIALFPNLNVADAGWREVVRDVRFRRALSLAVDRHELNQVLYFGLAQEGNDTVFEKSPLYTPAYRSQWAEFDLAKAGALLDEMGLIQRNRAGLRLLPDGRPMEIIVETAGENTEQVDALELISNTWRKIGIKLFSKPLQREVLRNRIYSGQTLMSVWSGLENGLPTADMSPLELAPTRQGQLQWPKWGQYFETGGEAGEPVDLAPAVALAKLNTLWNSTGEPERRGEIWHRMLEIRADQVFTIGTVAGVPQPVVVSSRLRNCPPSGVYNWEPGSHFGIYRPDTFWFDDPG